MGIPTWNNQFSVSFDVKATSFVNAWQSVIHFTTQENHNHYGSRVPAIWARASTTQSSSLHICSAINGNKNKCYNSAATSVGEWVSVNIAQDASGLYEIQINGESVFTEQNDDARTFNNVRVYAADGWYVPLDGVIRNFEFSSS